MSKSLIIERFETWNGPVRYVSNCCRDRVYHDASTQTLTCAKCGEVCKIVAEPIKSEPQGELF